MARLNMIAFDADDTLWHNETLFRVTQDKFRDLLLPYHDAEWIGKKLYETEMRNLALFGYGIKGFTLSMIETALELSENRIGGDVIQSLLDAAKEMLRAPVEPLPHVRDALDFCRGRFDLMIITKGDLFDQESKIARSGLDEYFKHIEIVSEKNAGVYRDLLEKYELDPKRFLMIGNSLKSDVLPLLELGAGAVHIPYHTTWQHEHVEVEEGETRPYHTLEHIGLLPALIEELA